MKAVVVGCGRVGSALAGMLADDGWEVSVVDRDEESLRRLGPAWRGGFLAGHGMDTEVLERAGIAGADAVIAATSGDNTNIVVAQVAARRYGVPSVAARIFDPARAEFYAGRGFQVVSPTQAAIESLAAWARTVGERSG